MRERGVRDRPENGCVGLEQNEMVPQGFILHRSLIKKFQAVTFLKEESVHCTKTITVVLNFLFENVTLIV